MVIPVIVGASVPGLPCGPWMPCSPCGPVSPVAPFRRFHPCHPFEHKVEHLIWGFSGNGRARHLAGRDRADGQHVCGACGALGAGRACCTGLTLYALFTLRTGRTRRTCRTGVALAALRDAKRQRTSRLIVGRRCQTSCGQCCHRDRYNAQRDEVQQRCAFELFAVPPCCKTKRSSLVICVA